MPSRPSITGKRIKKDKRRVLSEQKTAYESFRSRALVLGDEFYDSSSSALHDASNITSISTIPSNLLGSINEASTSSGADTRAQSVPSDFDFSINAFRDRSTIPERAGSVNSMTALQRLRRAAHTAVVTNHIMMKSTMSAESDDVMDENEESEEATTSKQPSTPPTLSIDTIHARNAGQYTIIAFVNSASGGGKGKSLYTTLQSHLGKSYVVDLHSCRPGNMPEDTLIKYAADPMVRILACGGDGTCGWLYSSLDKVWSILLGQVSTTSRVHLSKYKDHLPLAIMPLGTGNDLSRQFGWGGKFHNAMKNQSMISAVQNAKISKLDRWRCIIMPMETLTGEDKAFVPKILAKSSADSRQNTLDVFKAFMEEESRPSLVTSSRSHSSTCSSSTHPKDFPSTQLFDGVFCNYFSLGFDATIAYLFHHEREMFPERFTSPLKNKFVYVKKCPAALRAPKLRKRVKLLVNDGNGNMVKKQIPKSCRAIVS